MDYLVGIDVRADGVNCILVDEATNCVNAESVAYTDVIPEVGWLEQNADDWWNAVCQAVRALIEPISADDIVAIGLCGGLHGLVPLDKDNKIIRNAILFSDQRSAVEFDEVIEVSETEISDSNVPGFVPEFIKSKLKWIEQNEPDKFQQIERLVLPQDYIRYKLTGTFNNDGADANKGDYFTTEDKQWDSQIVANIGYNIVAFPPVSPSDAPCGVITPEAAALTGLRTGVPVYSASEEEVLKSVGMSLIAPGTLGIVLGGSGIIATQTKDIPNTADGRLESVQNADGTKNMVYGIELSCGDSIRWAQDALFEEEDDPGKALELYAERAPIGSHGVIFLPYLMGERSPHIDPGAKAVFYGLSIMARSKDLARSVIEGVVFGLYEIYELMLKENRKIEISEIVLSGEACRYPLVKQVVADVFDRPVKLFQGALMGTAYGAALIAGVGEQVFANMDIAESSRQVEEIVTPIEGDHERYQKSMQTYKELYEDLHKTFKKAEEKRHHDR